MSDPKKLTERLRDAAARKWPDPDVARHSLFAEAADTIAGLEAANEAFGQRQAWWNERMFELEAERDAARRGADEALRLCAERPGLFGSFDSAEAVAAAIRAAMQGQQ